LKWDNVYSGTAREEITGFDLTSLMADKNNNDDKSYLRVMIFWIR